MIVSVYIPDRCSRRTKEENLEGLSSRPEMINGLIQGELLRDPHTEVVIAGDFNRHNPPWEGGHISTTLTQEESAPIIDLWRTVHSRAFSQWAYLYSRRDHQPCRSLCLNLLELSSVSCSLTAAPHQQWQHRQKQKHHHAFAPVYQTL